MKYIFASSSIFTFSLLGQRCMHLLILRQNRNRYNSAPTVENQLQLATWQVRTQSKSNVREKVPVPYLNAHPSNNNTLIWVETLTILELGRTYMVSRGSQFPSRECKKRIFTPALNKVFKESSCKWKNLSSTIHTILKNLVHLILCKISKVH